MVSVKNRGKQLEKLIEYTNRAYKLRGVAVVDKVPTPWTVRYNRQRNKVINAWPEKKSTVDFVGVAQGRPIAFEVKSTNERTRFPLDLIQDHQVEYLRRFHDAGGMAFFIIGFDKLDEVYFLPVCFVEKYIEVAEAGGRKSIPIQDFREKFPRIGSKGSYPVHYLEFALGGI